MPYVTIKHYCMVSIYGESIDVIIFYLSDLKIHCQGHSDFDCFYVINEPSLFICYY